MEHFRLAFVSAFLTSCKSECLQLKEKERHMCSNGNKHLVRRTVLSQLAGNARGFCAPGSPLTTCLSKKTMQISAHAAQMQDQNAVLVLAGQKGSRADISSAAHSFGSPLECWPTMAGLWALRGCAGTAAPLQSSAAAVF